MIGKGRILVALFVLGSVLLTRVPARAEVIILFPTDTVTVPAATLADPGSTTGDIVVRERGSNTTELTWHISAFLNFDLSSISSFNPGIGDTATFQLTFQDQLNTAWDAGLYVGQITGGSWNSSSSLPIYNWATLSGPTIGPGSQVRDTLIIPNVRTDAFGGYSVDITDILDAWINNSEDNYGLGVYLGNNAQGAGFGNPKIIVNIPEPSSMFLLVSLFASLGLLAPAWRRTRRDHPTT